MFLEQPLGHFGRERSGGDGIDVDMGFGEEPGQVAGEMMHRRLAGGIGIIFDRRRGQAVDRTDVDDPRRIIRSEEHTSELQSLMRISYAVFCLKKKKNKNRHAPTTKLTN